MSKEGELRRSAQQPVAKEVVEQELDVEGAHRADAARRASLLGLRRAAVQQKSGSGVSSESVHAAAARGIATPTTIMPHVDKIQRAFGAQHDVTGIQAHVGGDAAAAMGASAFATGNHVVFDKAPDLHTAAHEAAHVIQQRQGVQLYGGVGQSGDAYERQADAVADRVVAGESAADLLGGATANAGGASAVQQQASPRLAGASVDERRDQLALARETGGQAILATLRLAAKEIDTAAAQIETIVQTPPDAAGMDRQLRGIEQAFDHAKDTVHRISLELASAERNRLPEGPEFERNLLIFTNAYTRLHGAVLKAKSYAAQDRQQPLTLDTQLMQDEIAAVFRARSIRPGDLAEKVSRMVGPKASDPRGEPASQLRGEALGANIEAVRQTARVIRMRMTTTNEEELGNNASLLALQAQELAACLDQTNPRAMGPYAAKLQSAMQEVTQLREELTRHPVLVNSLGDGSPFAETIRQIRQKAKRR